MRYIPLEQHLPDATWLAKAAAALAELEAAPDIAARNALIDAKSKIWSDLKSWLEALSYGKCWYSEVKDVFSHWHVEHYRPKKTAKDEDGTEHDGYWWLSFDWQNLRICGSVGNTKKGTFFPLLAGCKRVVDKTGDLRTEIPKLLDPTDPDDPTLLSFNQEGEAIAAPRTSAWEEERVTYSIKRLNLDFRPLTDKRKAVWSDCYQHICAYKEELDHLDRNPQNGIARQASKHHAKAIRAMIRPDQELSSVARACIESTGDPRVMCFLRST
jgi:uncharacterized protein (TIGR02646 family)